MTRQETRGRWVWRASGVPAQWLQRHDCGRIAPGAWAFGLEINIYELQALWLDGTRRTPETLP